jgi:hypothetical protein
VVRNTLTLLTPHTGSLLDDQQNKQSGSYQQGKQNTDDERSNPMPTGLDLFRPRPFCAAPIPNHDRYCHQCNSERGIPARRLRERDAKQEGSNGRALHMIDLNDIEDDSFLAINATDLRWLYDLWAQF